MIIDLERGALLDDVFLLPFEFAVPDLLFRRELIGPLGDQLLSRGLRVEALSSQEVSRATIVLRQRPALSVADTFAFSLAESRGWTLLTGDGDLRRLAIAERLDVHGVLWVIDNLEGGRHVSLKKLHEGLTAISTHPRCRLPASEIKKRLARYGQ